MPSERHPDGMSRRIDFHDMEISLEIQCPTTIKIVVSRCRRPDDLASKVSVDIDKLEAGEGLVLDTSQNQADGSVMFLTMICKGIERWWEIRWNISA